jgi:hypothetical protein
MNDKFQFRLENVNLNLKTLLPENIEIYSSNISNFRLKHNPRVRAEKTKVTIKISHLKPKLENIRFWYKNKIKGTPRMSDCGTMDLKFGGKGMSLTLDASLYQRDDGSLYFHVSRPSFKLDKINVKLHKDCKHHAFVNTTVAFLKPVLKSQIRKVIKTKLGDSMKKLEATVNELIFKSRNQKKTKVTKKKVSSKKQKSTGKTEIKTETKTETTEKIPEKRTSEKKISEKKISDSPLRLREKEVVVEKDVVEVETFKRSPEHRKHSKKHQQHELPAAAVETA